MTQSTAPVVSVIGGTGFLGQHVVRMLLQAGYHVKVFSRFPEKAVQLKTLGTMGRLQLIKGNIRSNHTLEQATDGVFAVINLVGLLFESGSQKFREVHTTAVKKLAHLAAEKDVKKVIHISALGVDKATRSRYAKTKHDGEDVVLHEFPHATVFRPSIIFGAEDNFFNQFDRMSRFLPFLPLIGGGHTLFQPVYVKDVVQAIKYALEHQECEGKIYELGGPHTYSFKELLQYVLRCNGRVRALIPLPFAFAILQGRLFELLPSPPLTRDQVTLLKTNNIVSDKSKGFKDLGIDPSSVEEIVPSYISA